MSVVIQAGGGSTRMGENKALMPFLGKPLITRVIARVEPVADEILITTNQPDTFAFLELPLIADIVPGLGALGGLYTALSAAHQDLVAVVACDMPFVNAALLAAERDVLVREGIDAVLPGTIDQMEPFHAVYRRGECLAAVKAAIDAGKRRAIAFLPQVRWRVMEEEELRRYDPALRAFLNVNTPEEFRKAEDTAAQIES